MTAISKVFSESATPAATASPESSAQPQHSGDASRNSGPFSDVARMKPDLQRAEFESLGHQFEHLVVKEIDDLMDNEGYSRERAKALLLNRISSEKESPPDDEVFALMHNTTLSKEDAAVVLSLATTIRRLQSRYNLDHAEAVEKLSAVFQRKTASVAKDEDSPVESSRIVQSLLESRSEQKASSPSARASNAVTPCSPPSQRITKKSKAKNSAKQSHKANGKKRSKVLAGKNVPPKNHEIDRHAEDLAKKEAKMAGVCDESAVRKTPRSLRNVEHQPPAKRARTCPASDL